MADNPQRRIFSMDTERVLKLERENAQLRAMIANRDDEIRHLAEKIELLDPRPAPPVPGVIMDQMVDGTVVEYRPDLTIAALRALLAAAQAEVDATNALYVAISEEAQDLRTRQAALHLDVKEAERARDVAVKDAEIAKAERNKLSNEYREIGKLKAQRDHYRHGLEKIRDNSPYWAPEVAAENARRMAEQTLGG